MSWSIIRDDESYVSIVNVETLFVDGGLTKDYNILKVISEPVEKEALNE